MKKLSIFLFAFLVSISSSFATTLYCQDWVYIRVQFNPVGYLEVRGLSEDFSYLLMVEAQDDNFIFRTYNWGEGQLVDTQIEISDKVFKEKGTVIVRSLRNPEDVKLIECAPYPEWYLK